MNKDTPQSNTPYNQIDHYHCWSNKNPPCGQRVKHFECCLCQKPHPDISQLLEAEKKKWREEVEGMRKKTYEDTIPDTDIDYIAARIEGDERLYYNQALDAVLQKLS